MSTYVNIYDEHHFSESVMSMDPLEFQLCDCRYREGVYVAGISMRPEDRLLDSPPLPRQYKVVSAKSLDQYLCSHRTRCIFLFADSIKPRGQMCTILFIGPVPTYVCSLSPSLTKPDFHLTRHSLFPYPTSKSVKDAKLHSHEILEAGEIVAIGSGTAGYRSAPGRRPAGVLFGIIKLGSSICQAAPIMPCRTAV